ncbi:MAG TPA: sulfite oxidase [Longimicrobiaceae bacterium]|nr:sulfite oxidase [Longimicrobiaceae bacterium]
MPGSEPGIGRRDFLAAAVAAAAGGSLVPRLLSPQTHAAGQLGLVILSPRPLNAETPLAAMTSWRTPNDLFFVRSHFGPPAEAAGPWTLTVDGEVERPLTLSLDELRRLPRWNMAVTLECAGNGRGLFTLPNTSGNQWTYGAVSNAEWTGVPLGAVLARAGMRPEAAHVWTEAADQAPLGGVPKFLRSVPREALGNALLAFEMNGEPIPVLHGGPLRLIVPGWFGMASTKWLTHLHARREPSDNHFMARSYRWADGTPVQQMRVKSLIAEPREGAHLPLGRLRVAGVAWTGTGRIRGVEVSSDGGGSWEPARLSDGHGGWSWRSWEHGIQVDRAGPVVLQARATDTTGATQPVRAAANPSGYGNNSVHEVRVHAAG